MFIDIEIHKDYIASSFKTKFKDKDMYMVIDDKEVFKQIDNGSIVLNNKTAFFVKDKETDKIFKVSVADFRPGNYGIGFPMVNEYSQNEFPYDTKTPNINGAIKFI